MLLDEMMALGQPLLFPHVPTAFEVSEIWRALPEIGWERHVKSLLTSAPARPPFTHTWWEWDDDTETFRAELRAARPDEQKHIAALGPPAPRAGSLVILGSPADAYFHLRSSFKGDAHTSLEAMFEEAMAAGAVEFAVVMSCARVFRRYFLQGVHAIALDADGLMIPSATGEGFVIFGGLTPLPGRSEAPERENEVSVQVTWQTMYMCAMLHVRNVVRVPTPIPEKLQRARVRRGKKPFVTFYTLRVVTPSQARAYERGESLPPQGVLPLHVVRGHFAHFADEDGKRLFGRFHGTYWRPAHVRGNPEVGAVIKDYALVPAGVEG